MSEAPTKGGEGTFMQVPLPHAALKGIRGHGEQLVSFNLSPGSPMLPPTPS